MKNWNKNFQNAEIDGNLHLSNKSKIFVINYIMRQKSPYLDGNLLSDVACPPLTVRATFDRSLHQADKLTAVDLQPSLETISDDIHQKDK